MEVIAIRTTGKEHLAISYYRQGTPRKAFFVGAPGGHPSVHHLQHVGVCNKHCCFSCLVQSNSDRGGGRGGGGGGGGGRGGRGRLTQSKMNEVDMGTQC
jgi:hypothetical protein